MEQIYLSRRNLQALLSKLDRNRNSGQEVSACTIVKYHNTHPKYEQSVDSVAVTAVENEEMYSNRPAGAMHPADDPGV